MWFFYALLSAVFAALVAILAKLGLKTVDSTIATTIRSVIMAVFLMFVGLSLGKLSDLSPTLLSHRDWLLIILSGVAGAISWLFYFLALKTGDASKVVALDRLSLVFVIFLSALVLGEKLGWKTALGALLMVSGAILVTLQ
jgi:transporter family protein